VFSASIPGSYFVFDLACRHSSPLQLPNVSGFSYTSPAAVVRLFDGSKGLFAQPGQQPAVTAAIAGSLFFHELSSPFRLLDTSSFPYDLPAAKWIQGCLKISRLIRRDTISQTSALMSGRAAT
jgi:hypothetical protein